MEPGDRYRIIAASLMVVSVLGFSVTGFLLTGLWLESFATACGVALVFRAYML